MPPSPPKDKMEVRFPVVWVAQTRFDYDTATPAQRKTWNNDACDQIIKAAPMYTSCVLYYNRHQISYVKLTTKFSGTLLTLFAAEMLANHPMEVFQEPFLDKYGITAVEVYMPEPFASLAAPRPPPTAAPPATPPPPPAPAVEAAMITVAARVAAGSAVQASVAEVVPQEVAASATAVEVVEIDWDDFVARSLADQAQA